MQPESSLPCSQKPAIIPEPEPDATSPNFPIRFPYDEF
jgi:hypothetical protein